MSKSRRRSGGQQQNRAPQQQNANPMSGGGALGMQSTHGNAHVQQAAGQSSQAGAQVCGADTYRRPTPVTPNGDLQYYNRRHTDFTGRYSDCADVTPPDYYLGYGMKYVSRFTNETNQRLTPEGQSWLIRARENLQLAIENRREADERDFDRMEKNNDEFRAFAFASHPDAYWEAGLGELSVFDLANIGATPDFADLLGWDGLAQAADIGGRLVSVWGTDAVDYVGGEGATEELVDAMYSGYAAVGDEIDGVFGEGTTDYLEEQAAAAGAVALDLAEDAHGVLASGASMASDGVDSVFGEGTAAATGTAVREGINDAADLAEDAWNWIWD